MSMIVIGAETPDSCGNCEFNQYGLRCHITRSDIDRDYECAERLGDCPIKSVEGLIEKIRKMPNANPSYWNQCDVVDREDLIEIIKEYCGVSEDV